MMMDGTRPGPRAILFDLGGVLIDWNPRHLYRSLFADEAEMERFLAEVVDARWNQAIDAGRPFAEAIRERQAQVPEYSEFIGMWHSRWKDMLNGEIPGTVAILRELKELGRPLYALSNWSAETFPVARERFEFLSWFNRIVVSGEVGLAKPDPAIYRYTLEKLGTTPEETLFLDDKLVNIEAAQALGMTAFQFSNVIQLRQDLLAAGQPP